MTAEVLNQKRHKKKGLLFIFMPFVAIVFSLLLYTFSTFFFAIQGIMDSPVLTLINYVLGLMALVALFSFFICIPLGFRQLRLASEALTDYDKRSGQGSASEVPSELKKWNWGAAGLTFIWALSHRLGLGFLVFVPTFFVWFSSLFLLGPSVFFALIFIFLQIFEVLLWFIFGVWGNAWAWKKNRWKSVEAFQKSQNQWKVIGIICFILKVVVFISRFS